MDGLDTIAKYLSIAYRAQASLLNKKLADYDIGRGQYPFLIALYHQDGICQQDLCKIYDIDKAAAGRAVKKLEEKGFIKRERDPKDKRCYLLYLTEKSRNFKPVFLNILQSIEEEIKSDLTQEEVEIFMKIIKKICKNLGFKSGLDGEE
ncbi:MULTISPECIES: MarR family winged helix-turn-helix transcriptional regulator [unclassified Candidatus Frackibacter]|uniref:MarR family winged helix-turn-helix transcriptional regulator n=1 Tax=unclassified Candidatus Frackibacter TaxID=2648818 RepID=UPI0008829FAC|nr:MULTISPECIES: MarR family transcriptional regulator [unclassified Candidatus Frackibacter]SDC68184.1 DNA-binding transcriptional regulator, MarR family [Candidatus Frackibacter sp. WG11]SEM83466.1 DNA-binding transcriptional regulator, MarR family [Candidatus Frackibacter sp. WG12]SFL91797.1 DNA-binding transcriptional regulator, MarR family [Candidatus Frackibacter sp. WG13]